MPDIRSWVYGFAVRIQSVFLIGVIDLIAKYDSFALVAWTETLDLEAQSDRFALVAKARREI